MTLYLLFLFAIVIFILSGLVVLAFVDGKNELSFSLPARLAASFLLGMGLVSLQMFFYTLLGIKYSVLPIALPWILLSLYLIFISARSFLPVNRNKDGSCSFLKRGNFERILILIIALQVGYAFFASELFPPWNWDAWAMWLSKATAFFIEKGISSEFLQSPVYGVGYSAPHYPLLISLSATWVYTCIGMVDDTLVKLLDPLRFLSLLLLFNYVARRVATQRMALLFTALLSLTPIIMVHSGGYIKDFGAVFFPEYLAHADLSISIYFMAAAAFFYLYMLEGDQRFVLLSILFALLSTWTKNEGQVFFLLLVLSMVIYQHLVIHKFLNKRILITLAVMIVLFILPWAIYKAHFDFVSSYGHGVGAQSIVGNLGRVWPVLGRALWQAFCNLSLFNFTWYLYLLTSILNWRGTVRFPLAVLHSIMAAQFAAYVFVFVITPADLSWQIDTSMDRLVLHLVPLAIFISLTNLSAYLKRRDGASAD